MATVGQKNDSRNNSEKMRQIAEYVKGLSEEHKMLVILKSQLYDGSWNTMLDDLHNRLDGKPYIFKLANRIGDDIERIKQMQQFEQNNNVNLADYIDTL